MLLWFAGKQRVHFFGENKTSIKVHSHVVVYQFHVKPNPFVYPSDEKLKVVDITDSFLSIGEIRDSRLRMAIKGSERSSPISGEFRLHKATNQMTLITAGSWLQLAGGKLPYVGQSEAC